MTLVSLEKISRHFGDFAVLDGLSLRVDEGDRIGVVGDNGSGKTTMVRILAGADEPDVGQRNTRRDLRVAFGEQMPELPNGCAVEDYVLRGNGQFNALEQRIRELEAALAENAGDENALEQYGHLQAAFEAGGGYQRQHLCEKVLQGLGFSAPDRNKDIAVLSGGERSRVQLAALMTTPADLLILDEPTNHLDLQGIEFVEDFIQRYPGAVVAVSHDRRFLDAMATSVVELEDGRATSYKGNYSAYVKQRDERFERERRLFKSQREFIDKEMDFIRRNMAGQKHRQAKSRLKRLQRLERTERPKDGSRGMHLRFSGGKGLEGQTVMEAENLGLRLPTGRWLLRGGEMRVYLGEVVALLGRNGAGKTTLLKVLAGLNAPATGEVKTAQKLRVGYFSQDNEDLPTTGTVLEALRAVDPTAEDHPLRSHLALFLFCGDDVDKPVTELSGGEKQRLSLARLTRSSFDLLCMDEPTNHLDVGSTEGLEQSLKDFPGTAVLITHDRALVTEVANRVAWIEDGELRSFERGLEHCMAWLRERRARRRAEAVADKPERLKAEPSPAKSSGKIRNPLMFQRLEDKIIALEEQLETLRAQMLLPENYQDHLAMRALQTDEARLQDELAAAYEQWENWT